MYEARLVKDPGGKSAASPLYLQLAALGRFVIKICKPLHEHTWSAEIAAWSRLEQAGIQDCSVPPIHWGGLDKQPFTIYPLCVPALPAMHTQPATPSPLKARHFVGLLEDLCRIHKAGLMHYDIRVENLMILDDAAKLVDFGYLAPPVESRCIRGTLETASQDVLAAACREEGIAYKKRDDLESLLKAFLIHQYKVRVQYVANKPPAEILYKTWQQLVLACRLRGRDYDGVQSHLERVFGGHSTSVKDHQNDP